MLDLTASSSAGGPDAVLSALDPEQRAVATALRGPVCVLAGAGTGKTRAITHRIAYGVQAGVYQPNQVLAVTFTTRAAGEMRTRLRELGVAGVQSRTFHSAALRQARYFWPRVYDAQLPEIIDSKLRFVGEAARRCRLEVDTAGRRDLASEIEWAKVSNVRPDDYAEVAGRAGRQVTGFDLVTVARVFAAYEAVRREHERIDLEDVLLCAVALLADNPKIAATVRAQYRHFVVDEYQDVSPLQQTLLDLWLGERDELCVVGDVSQTIYSFAGADPSYLSGFARRFPTASVIRLVRDYRSTPQVVRVANAVFANAPAGSRDARVVLQAQRPDGPAPRFADYPDEVAEADGVARAIERLHADGVPLREIAVLFRINAQSEVFEQALADRGIAYLVRGAERFFERREVREAVALLRGAARAGEEPGRGLVDHVRDIFGTTGWSPTPPDGTGVARERWESLAALVALAEDVVTERSDTGLSGLVTVLDERIAAQHAPAADGVTLATLHSAKGLEWDAVFLAGLVDGTLPITYAVRPDEVEEERRLFYVGVTRARSSLSMSWALARTPGARGRRSPSRFLDGIRPASGSETDRPAGRARAPRTSSRAPRCRVCDQPLRDAAERKIRRCAQCPATFDEQLFERLRSWRLDQATEQNVPAFVVFTDATLTAIAESRPSDIRELAKIPGVGAAKLERYGTDVLAMCAPSEDSASDVLGSGGSGTVDQVS